jgi:hypothetical protein
MEGEIHPGCANFCGPGTRIDLPQVRNFPPYNNVDAVCRTHDFAYEAASRVPGQQGEQLRRQADLQMLQALEQYPNEDYHDIAKLAISAKVAAENLAPGIMRRILPRYFGGHMPKNPTRTLFESVPKEGLTKDTQRAIKLIAYDPEEIRVYGSFNYRAQAFPGDLDLVESVILCPKGCSKETALHHFKKVIQEVIRKISNTKDVFIGDIKLCIDNDIYSLTSRDYWGTVSPDVTEITNFRPVEVRRDLKHMGDAGWIPTQKVKELLNLVGFAGETSSHEEHISFEKYALLVEEMRNLTVLRWTPKEILQGYKILSGGRRTTIEKALDTCYDPKTDRGSLVKVDTYIPIDGKYVEVTNLLIAGYINEEKNRTHLTFGEFKEDRLIRGLPKNQIEGLREEIAKYYFHYLPKDDKPIKYAKRIFSLAQLFHDASTARKLADLWHSDINLMNQVKSEVDTLTDLLEFNAKAPLGTIKRQVDAMKAKLIRILTLPIHEEDYHLIDHITKGTTTRPEMMELLEKLSDSLKERINPAAKKFLEEHQLYPAPKKYLDRHYLDFIIA